MGAVKAGIKPSGGLDLAILVSDRPCSCAGTFTLNRIAAAPVQWDRSLLPSKSIRAVVINAGNANAATGAELWKNYVGMGVIAAPTVWSRGGKQYVSVLAGYGGSVAAVGGPALAGWKYAMPRRLVTYTLGGKAVMKDLPRPTMKVAVVDNPKEVLDPKAITMGRNLWLACGACHGKAAIGAGGPAPDLRESAVPLDPDAFYSVVHDGALIQRGMPGFALFGKPVIDGLRQYIRAQARLELARQKKPGDK